MRKFILLVAFGVCSTCLSIKCDKDGHEETILGINLAANFLPCGHTICDRHARYTKNGRWLCPIDGKHGGK